MKNNFTVSNSELENKLYNCILEGDMRTLQEILFEELQDVKVEEEEDEPRL